ncbi:MAG: RrF2 family transcriptional regulator [Oscillospiraceae bacterium]|nr:RrF2 family transcriptional regulator [Oscillospiraceae bacterium]
MVISTKGRYALRMMLDLAQQDPEAYISLKSIAVRQGISVKYMEAIAAHLNRAGLVVSQRGKEGGYRLARTAQEITVAEVLHSAEGSLAAVACLELDGQGTGACERAEHCLTLPLWRKLDAMMDDFLSGVTVQDVLDGNV